MKYLNSVKTKLFEGNKIEYRGYVYWANLETMEIYRMSVESRISGNINGTLYAHIDADWNIVK